MDDSSQTNLSSFKEYAQEHGLEIEISEERGGTLKLVLQSARSKHQLAIPIGIAEKYVDIDFAQYKFFREYYGIVSYDRGYLEAEIDSVGDRTLLDRVFGRLAGPVGSNEPPPPRPINFGQDMQGEVRVTISPASDEFRLMVGSNSYYSSDYRSRLLDNSLIMQFYPGERPLTIKICHLEVECFSEARRLLKDISNSCFFFLSRELNIDLELRSAQQSRMRPREIQEPEDALPMPQHKYPSEAMSLYRYGLSAQRMPLLQFLAFYQVVEFFFKEYSMREVRDLVINYLKDPKFSLYNDQRVQSLIDIVKNHRASNERDQLKSTLKATLLQPQDIIDWITADEDRARFFRDRNLFKKTSDNALDLRKPENLISQLAGRIYNIRCNIVHTKASGTETDFILPHSEAAAHLPYDIDLMQEVAERVLIASSSELQIQKAI